jgi:DNA-binding NarL/FixJ family response regulator
MMTNKPTILVVDDTPANLQLMSGLLQEDYKVKAATSGEKALKIAFTDPQPDLILLDIMMPEMDGYSLVQKLRSDPDKQWIPVIFLSAKGQSNDRIKGLETGADVYMVKPFEPEELVAQVKSSLRQTDRLLQHSSKTGSLEGSFSQVPENIELTQTEIKVIQLVAQGLPNKEIAERLHVSQRTIESHVSNMLSKTNLNNRTELSRWAVVKNLA